MNNASSLADQLRNTIILELRTDRSDQPKREPLRFLSAEDAEEFLLETLTRDRQHEDWVEKVRNEFLNGMS